MLGASLIAGLCLDCILILLVILGCVLLLVIMLEFGLATEQLVRGCTVLGLNDDGVCVVMCWVYLVVSYKWVCLITCFTCYLVVV